MGNQSELVSIPANIPTTPPKSIPIISGDLTNRVVLAGLIMGGVVHRSSLGDASRETNVMGVVKLVNALMAELGK